MNVDQIINGLMNTKDKAEIKLWLEIYKNMDHSFTEPLTQPLMVESSNIDQIGYNEKTQVLEITFSKTKAVYRYHDVSENIYNELMSAQSKGSYFNKNIMPNYKTIKAC